MTLKDKRWSWYHIFDKHDRRLSSKPVRGCSDNQALGNFFRGNKWPEGVYAKKIRSMNVHPQQEEHVDEIVEEKTEEDLEVQLSFNL